MPRISVLATQYQPRRRNEVGAAASWSKRKARHERMGFLLQRGLRGSNFGRGTIGGISVLSFHALDLYSSARVRVLVMGHEQKSWPLHALDQRLTQ